MPLRHFIQKNAPCTLQSLILPESEKGNILYQVNLVEQKLYHGHEIDEHDQSH